MKRAPVTLHDQIDIVEKRVRLEKLQLTVAIQGLRTSVWNIVSGPGGVAAIFLVAAVAGIYGGRKLTSRRRTLLD
jgi:hypothetical protein